MLYNFIAAAVHRPGDMLTPIGVISVMIGAVHYVECNFIFFMRNN